MIKNFKALSKKAQEGASAVEYGLIVGLIAIAIATVVVSIGDNLGEEGLFGKADTALTNANTTPP